MLKPLRWLHVTGAKELQFAKNSEQSTKKSYSSANMLRTIFMAKSSIP